MRRTIQALSFCFLLYLILQTAFPLELKIPVDLYLRLDPFIGIITILTKKEFHSQDAPGLRGASCSSSFLAISSVDGSAPWGPRSISSIGFSSGKGRGPKDFNEQPLRRLRYGVFLFSIIAGLMAWQVMYLLDPISLITRTLVISFYPPAIFIFNHLLPQIQNFLPRNPFIIPTIPLPLFKVNLFIFLFFVIVLALGVMRKRFWCRYLCPLGTLFSIFSRLPNLETICDR